MYVITGVSGHTGSAAAASLLKQGKPIRVLVRSQEKGKPWKAQAAEVAVASLDDPAALERALAGAHGLYYLVPPDLTAADFLGRGRRFVDALHAVLAKTPVPHVVFLSSIGAQHPAGAGPIRTLHYGEERLRSLPLRLTFLRAAYFMENTATLLPAMKTQGVLPAFFAPDKKIAMVAARDIGTVAARALVDPPSATQVIELAGPDEHSLADAALAYSRVLGKAIAALRVPEAGIVPALTQQGISANVAELFREMAMGIERGHVAFEGGAAKRVRGTITLDDFVRQTLAA